MMAASHFMRMQREGDFDTSSQSEGNSEANNCELPGGSDHSLLTDEWSDDCEALHKHGR